MFASEIPAMAKMHVIQMETAEGRESTYNTYT